MQTINPIQLNELVLQTMGHLMHNYRDNIVGLLKEDGYNISNLDSDEKIRVTMLDAVKTSEGFRNRITELVTGVQQYEAEKGGDKTLSSLFSNMSGQLENNPGNINRLFSTTRSQQYQTFNNGAGAVLEDVNNDTVDNGNWWDFNYQTGDYLGNSTPATTTTNNTSNSSSSSGGFLSGLFSGSNLTNLINSGLSYLSGSLNAKNQQAANQTAAQVAAYQAAAAQAQAQAAIAAAQSKSATPGWVLPVVIGLPLSIGAVIIVIYLVKKKK